MDRIRKEDPDFREEPGRRRQQAHLVLCARLPEVRVGGAPAAAPAAAAVVGEIHGRRRRGPAPRLVADGAREPVVRELERLPGGAHLAEHAAELVRGQRVRHEGPRQSRANLGAEHHARGRVVFDGHVAAALEQLDRPRRQLLRALAGVQVVQERTRRRRHADDAAAPVPTFLVGFPALQERRRHKQVVGAAVRADPRER
mmetsp:Transcript_17159/g.52785  ORF Transcript_17159/g.52785 Transcript_17159/m.52785 type:complete len:200 (-) Transcript_17159:2276-2875(-)